MAGTVVADTLQAASTSTLVLKNGVASTPPTVQDSAGTEIGTFCRAWVNFNGTTVTNPASMTGVNGSFNISSVLDNGTGNYTISFTNAMPDVNYAICASCSGALNTNVNVVETGTQTANNVVVFANNQTSGALDPTTVSIAIFR